MTEVTNSSVEEPRAQARRPWRPQELYDSYGIVLLATIVTLGVVAALEGRPLGRAIALFMVGGIFFLTLRVSSVSRHGIRRAAWVCIPALAAAAIASVVGAETVARAVTVLVLALVIIACVFVIIRRLVQQPEISMKTVLGASCLYLFLGLFFATLCNGLDLINGPFFVQTPHPSSIDYVYFSLITISTVGYGDFTAATNFGKMSAAIVAIIGQLYLVTIVALLIGNFGRARSSHKAESDRAPSAVLEEPPAQRAKSGAPMAPRPLMSRRRGRRRR